MYGYFGITPLDLMKANAANAGSVVIDPMTVLNTVVLPVPVRLKLDLIRASETIQRAWGRNQQMNQPLMQEAVGQLELVRASCQGQDPNWLARVHLGRFVCYSALGMEAERLSARQALYTPEVREMLGVANGRTISQAGN